MIDSRKLVHCNIEQNYKFLNKNILTTTCAGCILQENYSQPQQTYQVSLNFKQLEHRFDLKLEYM